MTELTKIKKSKINIENDKLQRKERRKQHAFVFELVRLFFSWGEALFLNVPHPYFLGRGDFWLRDSLAQSYGAGVKTF